MQGVVRFTIVALPAGRSTVFRERITDLGGGGFSPTQHPAPASDNWGSPIDDAIVMRMRVTLRYHPWDPGEAIRVLYGKVWKSQQGQRESSFIDRSPALISVILYYNALVWFYSDER